VDKALTLISKNVIRAAVLDFEAIYFLTKLFLKQLSIPRYVSVTHK
jgi:hypothetical protein